MPSASVIVPTYNRPVALARTLEALRDMDVAADSLEIVVVDTGGDENGEATAEANGVTYARRTDAGVASARNHGAGLASGELLLFVDDDIVVEPSNLRRHAAIHQEHERCLVSGHWAFDPALRRKLEQTPLGRFRLSYEDLYNKPAGLGGEGQTGQVHPLTLAAANLSIRKDVFWSLGGFDERFPVGAEDQDLSWRAARAGCTLVYDFDIRVIHNDQHTGFAALCRRFERGAIGTVYFARKNPDAQAPPMLTVNAPIRRGDPLRLVARKLSRSFLSQSIALAFAQHFVKLLERVRPNGGWPLEYVYRAVGGLYVFRGVRVGLQLTAGNHWQRGHRLS
ncbi:MAG TPA: glycosyltransferase [Thermoleophilaceae bacterium]|nr:glycosyltransferase [Thermoleophilaceae bacterium]